jgi:putative transposase
MLSGADAPPAGDTAAPTVKNRRNGHSRKTVSGDMGDINLQTPHDRNGSFEPTSLWA